MDEIEIGCVSGKSRVCCAEASLEHAVQICTRTSKKSVLTSALQRVLLPKHTLSSYGARPGLGATTVCLPAELTSVRRRLRNEVQDLHLYLPTHRQVSVERVRAPVQCASELPQRPWSQLSWNRHWLAKLQAELSMVMRWAFHWLSGRTFDSSVL